MPLMAVSAYMTFCLPSTLVLHIRKICWKFCDWNCTDMIPGAFKWLGSLGFYCLSPTKRCHVSLVVRE